MFDYGAIAERKCLAGSKLVKFCSIEMLVEHKRSDTAKNMNRCCSFSGLGWYCSFIILGVCRGEVWTVGRFCGLVGLRGCGDTLLVLKEQPADVPRFFFWFLTLKGDSLIE